MGIYPTMYIIICFVVGIVGIYTIPTTKHMIIYIVRYIPILLTNYIYRYILT